MSKLEKAGALSTGYMKSWSTLPPGKPANAIIEAIEQGRTQLCLSCDPKAFKDCVNCYESKNIKIRQMKFRQALELGIDEDIARKMFTRGDLL